MKNKLSKNGSSFSLQKISSDVDLRKLEDQQRNKIKQKFRIRRIDSKHNIVKFKFFSPISQFKELGAGIYYYFYFIKFFMIVFFIISLLSVIGISMAMTGNGLQQFKEDGFFLRTTISNSHDTYLSNEEIEKIKHFNEEEKHEFFQEKNSQNTLQFYILMTSDFIGSLCFLIAIYTFQILSVKRVNSIDIKRPSARHYAIQVDNLPTDNIKEAEVKQFFSQFYLVKNVAFSYKFGENFQTLVEINKTKEQIKNFLKKDHNKMSKKNIKKRQKLYEKFKQQIQKVHKDNEQKFNLTNFENFEIINAFVIFNESKVPALIHNRFKQAYQKTFFEKFFCKKKIIEKRFLFRGKYKIKISQPDHPANFHWENVQYTKSFRRKRLGLLYLTIFFIILLSFIINLFLTAFTNNYDGQKCEGTYEKTLIDKTDHSAEMREYIYCYCSQFPFYYLFKQQNENFNICQQELMNQFQQLIIILAIAVAISIVNMIIQTVIFKMVKYIKYSTLTQGVIKQINLTLLAEYCNTTFVLTLIYKTTFDLSLPEFFNTLTGSEFFRLNQTPHFNRFWYILVAKKLFIPFMLLCFNPHTSEWIVCFFKSFIADIRSKYIKNKKKFVEVYQLPTFDLGYRFKNVLKLVIVCYTFSSGIPLFNIFIFFGLLFTFIFHKIILINYSGKVPPYSIEIIKSIFKVLKISLLIHLFFSMLFFSDYEIFPSQNKYFINIGVGNDTDNEFIMEILDHIYQVFPLFALFVITFLCIFFEVFVIGLFQKIIEYFTKRKITNIESDKTYEDVKKQLKNTAILNYEILSNPTYNNILNFKKTDLQMLKTMVLNKSLGQIIKLYSQSHQNLEKITTLEQNCLEILDEEKQQNNLENIDISGGQKESSRSLKNLQHVSNFKNIQSQSKKNMIQSNLKQDENKSQSDRIDFSIDKNDLNK